MKLTCLPHKLSSFLSVFVLVVCMFTGGLPAQSKTKDPSSIVFASGTTGATYYYIGAGLTKIINDKIPGLSSSTEATNSSPQMNFPLTQNSPDTMGMGTVDAFFLALSGKKEDGYRGPQDKLRVVMIGHTQTGHQVVLANSRYKTMANLKGRTVGTLTKGSSVRAMTTAIFEEYGLTEGKDYKYVPSSLMEMIDAIKDGNIDAISTGGAVPMAGIVDLASSNRVRLLDIDPAVHNSLKEKHPYYDIGTIPGGTYPGQDEDVFVLEIPTLLVCNEALSEEFVYRFAKTVYENIDMLVEIHPQGKHWNLETTLDFYKKHPDLPWHPGIKRLLEDHLANN